MNVSPCATCGEVHIYTEAEVHEMIHANHQLEAELAVLREIAAQDVIEVQDLERSLAGLRTDVARFKTMERERDDALTTIRKLRATFAALADEAQGMSDSIHGDRCVNCDGVACLPEEVTAARAALTESERWEAQ